VPLDTQRLADLEPIGCVAVLLADGVLAKKAGAFDCASAYYFFGRRRETAITDRDVVAAYRV
jgi:hypothetical protein